MQIPVLIEPIANNGFQAKTGEPLQLTAEGPTCEEALRNLRYLLDSKLRNGAKIAALDLEAADNPWVTFAGMFRDNPLFGEWQGAIAENRRKAEDDPDVL